MRARVPIAVLRQDANASFAAAIAALISSGVVSGTRASTCWVAGLVTSRQRDEADSMNRPLISSLTAGAEVATALCDDCVMFVLHRHRLGRRIETGPGL